VMIDGRGKVRITDFGLACLSDELRSSELHAGTPAYMAPEQLARKEVSARSDIYALGLVLYEIFTGRRAFQAASLTDLIRLHQRAHPAKPSNYTSDVDPAIERLIMSCLEKDPAARPDLRQIAVGLSRGDPLAAALAAGETPSPEMLAAAPGEGTLRPSLALAFLVVSLASLALMVLLSGRALLHHEVPLDHSPDVLAFRAREIVHFLGYPGPAASVCGFATDDAYLDYVAQHDSSPQRWDRLRNGRPAAVYFWYRQGPEPLVAESLRKVSPSDPPLDVPQMVTVFLDTTGRLMEFRAVPSPGSGGTGGAPEWRALFAAAKLDPASLKPTMPTDTPWSGSDARAAWEGVFPEDSQFQMRVEAAAFRGVPVYFRISGPWSAAGAKTGYTPSEGRAGYRQGSQSPGFFVFSFVIFTSAIVVGMFLARRNLRLGRGDREGAFRLALFVFLSQMLAWFFRADHVSTRAEIDLFYTAVAWAMYYAIILWVLYLALEPQVRRRWPYRIMSWSRVLAGRLRDPMVGRDLLVGATAGSAATVVAASVYIVTRYLGLPPDKPPAAGIEGLGGIPQAIGLVLTMQKEVISDPIYVLVTLLLLAALLRKEWLSFGVAWVLFSLGAGLLFGVHALPNWLVVSLVVAGYLGVLTHYGLLAAMSFQFFNYVLLNLPLTSDFSAWYGSVTVFMLLITVSFLLYAFRTSLTGQPGVRIGLFRD